MRRASSSLFGAWLLAILLGAIGLLPHASAQNQSYLPFDRSAVRPRFRMDPLGSVGPASAPRALAVGVSGASLEVTEDGDTIVTGSDRAGRTWSVQTGFSGCAGGGPTFFKSDLDRNGIQDLVMVAPTCGNGLAPSSHVFTLMFDDSGRPVPFEADGYFELLENGIFDVADLNGDGRADLLYMNFDDGYWITNVYTARAARWRRVEGRFGRYAYPLFTRFTNRPNHRPTTPKPGRRPFAPDLSQTHPAVVGRMQSYNWANVRQSEDIQLNVVGSNGRRETVSPASWYSSLAIVLDGKAGRRVVTLSANESVVRGMLDEIVDKGYRTSLYGRRRRDVASPELVWADSGQ
jgi:hypothetical protein